MDTKNLLSTYHALKEAQNDLGAGSVTDILEEICNTGRLFLGKCDAIPLESDASAQPKEYFSFQRGSKLSRAINKELFLMENDPAIPTFFNQLRKGKWRTIHAHEATQALYTIAMSFCAVIDLEKSGDQKTPGTFFEYLVGHIFARRLATSPTKSLQVLNLDLREGRPLPTDFIFDLGINKPKFHVPVKTSTRERVIQVWAHQRVIDGVYGVGRYLGLLTCLAETKVSTRTKVVSEICLPDQWRLYQMFIAQMNRVYYLDIPGKYASLNKVFPKIRVLELGEFFRDTDALLKG